MPILLSVVYMEVGRRLGLQIDGIGFLDIFWSALR